MSSGRLGEEVVVDAGPLIALARLDELALPGQIFSRTVVTQTVVNECLVDPPRVEDQPIRSAIENHYLEVYEDGQEQPDDLWNLDPGEASVIALARKRAAVVLVDDRAARKAANAVGVPVIGICGLLLVAKHRNLITAVSPCLQRLVESGYYLDSALVDRVRKLSLEA